MKSLGMLLYVAGAIMLLALLVWGRTGIYSSQMPGFVTLGVAGFASLLAGGALTRDKNPHGAVTWKPTDALQSAEGTSMAPIDANESGEMMNCPHCGLATRVGVGYCGNCGVSLATASPASVPTLAPPPPPPSTTSSPPPPSSSAMPQQQPPPPPPQASEPPKPPAAPETTQMATEAPIGATAVAEPAPEPSAEPEPIAEPKSAAEQESSATAEESVVLEDSAMITLPPGLVGAPPASTPAAPSAPTVAEAVFITSPGIPATNPPVEEEDVDATRASTRRRSGSPWRLVLPDGEHLVVDGIALIGRNPAARAKWPGAKLLSVDDTTKSVSKTHAAIEVDSDGLWVTDLKSTNGVVVTSADGNELEGDGGKRMKVEPGGDIELGDFIIQVEKD